LNQIPPDPSVLLVDDDPALLEALSEALGLRFKTIMVDVCDSGAAALELVARKDYDAVITDIKMPGMDGLELVARLREQTPDIPTLLITGHGETDLAIQAIRTGAFDFIQKPIDRDYLMAALKRATEVRRLRRELKAKQEALQDYAEHLEHRVEERTEELQRALRAKDEFLGLVSHELRTPITVIFGNAELLNTRGAQLDEAEKAAAIFDLRQETRRLLRIIENLLVLARLEYGIKTETEPVLLSKIVKLQVDRQKQLSPDRDLKLHVPADLPVVNCDATQVELVLNNLLSNADKYSPPGRPIEIRANVVDSEVVVSVLDRGIGIGPEETERIFEAFHRSQPSSGIQGMGIGLTVCKRLLESQRGKIWAKPRPGGGSQFSFSLPIASGSAIESAPADPASATLAEPLPA